LSAIFLIVFPFNNRERSAWLGITPAVRLRAGSGVFVWLYGEHSMNYAPESDPAFPTSSLRRRSKEGVWAMRIPSGKKG
jgi:hypothetical protein